MLRQFQLVDRVLNYEPEADEAALNKAYVFAVKMHGEQKRASGDPYFSHPVEVAGILTDLKLDTASIITALLHDTIEDTEATYAEIKDGFGEEVAHLVDGVTKLSQLELSESSHKQAQNFRKFIMATADDVRVLLVKLADRLHNMRTLNHIKDAEKRQRIAQETMDIYAPLAGRLGMQNFREELEDIAFGVLNPEARNIVQDRLLALQKDHSDLLDEIAYELKTILAQYDLPHQIEGRLKRPFSIWQKIERRSISMEQLSDIYGYRVIVEREEDCYRALGILHRQFRHVPGRYKDYISNPKLNNYRSLHTIIIGPHKRRIEVQIRTNEMHQIAERGVAAHWHYKEGTSGANKDIDPINQLQTLIAQLRMGAENAEEFMEHTRLELFVDQVFCFTPKGRLIAMPQGATLLDFAYAVHTEIGHSCVGALVNGRRVSIRDKMQNGDEVEILTGVRKSPKQAWLSIVKTGKARAAIRHYLRERDQGEYVELGQTLLTRFFARTSYELTDDVLQRGLTSFGLLDIEDLYRAVGKGKISCASVLRTVHPRAQKKGVIARAVEAVKNRQSDKFAVPVGYNLHGQAMRFAENYYLVPGDDIVGILQSDQGLVIYPAKDKMLDQFENEPDRWVQMKWDVDKDTPPLFLARLALTLFNRTGALSNVSETIADFNANITNLTLTQKGDDFYNLVFDLEVVDVEHIRRLISALRGLSVVNKIDRIIHDESEG